MTWNYTEYPKDRPILVYGQFRKFDKEKTMEVCTWCKWSDGLIFGDGQRFYRNIAWCELPKIPDENEYGITP